MGMTDDDFARMDNYLGDIKHQRDENMKSTLISQGVIWGSLLAFKAWMANRAQQRPAQPEQLTQPALDAEIQRRVNVMAQEVSSKIWLDRGLKVKVIFPIIPAVGDMQAEAVVTVLEGPNANRTFQVRFVFYQDDTFGWQYDDEGWM